MANPSSLRMESVTLDDVAALTDVWFAAFGASPGINLWPDTPGVRKWLDGVFQDDVLNKPLMRLMKVVDPQTLDAQSRPRIAAFVRWDLAMLDERGPRFPPWHEDMSAESLVLFFQKEDDERQRVMGNLKHYYLDTLATHPDYQRRGAGSMLVKWGCDLADRDGVAAYVDASKAGAPLYARFGFVDESLPDAGSVASMARR